jgi:hypothetical protein
MEYIGKHKQNIVVSVRFRQQKRIDRLSLAHNGVILYKRTDMREEHDKLLRFDEHSQSFNLQDTDFKEEVVASGLKESGYDAERIVIFCRGDIGRGFLKDIHDILPEYFHYDLTDYLYLYVNRRSLYDELPEGIFHKILYQSEKI